MASKLPSVPICLKSELDHFSLRPIQTAIESSRVLTYQPINNNLTSDTITFEVTSTPEDAIDLFHSELLLDVCVMNSNGTIPPVAASNFGPINSFARSLFCGHQLLLNNEVVTSIPTMSHIASYVENLLNFGASAQTSLQDAGWKLDDPGSLDNALLEAPDTDATYKVNNGMISRRENLLLGSTWRLFCKLPTDLANQPLLIPPRVDLKLSLNRSKDRFALMSADAAPSFKTVIKAATLRIRKIRLDSEFLIAHEIALQKQNALIPYVESNILEFGVPT